jgi:hypothetical protein
MYCGDGCRAAAAYEIRRISRRLEFVEGWLAWMRGAEPSNLRDAIGRTRDEQIEALEAQRQDDEQRMAALLTAANGIRRRAE